MSNDRNTLLKDRARALAKVAESAAPVLAGFEVLVFTLANERVGLEAEHVREVCPPMELTPIPCTPAFVAGVINVRGDILAVIDLKVYFEIQAATTPGTGEVIIAEVGNSFFGILADSVIGLSFVPLSGFQPLVSNRKTRLEKSLKGMSADQIGVLDIAGMLEAEKLWVHEEVEP